VHVNHALPRADVVVLDRTPVAEDARVMHQTVETAVTRLDLFYQMLVLRALSSLEVELRNSRFRSDRGDLVVKLLERAAVAPMKEHRSPEPCCTSRQRAPYASCRARDQDDSILQQPVPRRVVFPRVHSARLF